MIDIKSEYYIVDPHFHEQYYTKYKLYAMLKVDHLEHDLRINMEYVVTLYNTITNMDMQVKFYKTMDDVGIGCVKIDKSEYDELRDVLKDIKPCSDCSLFMEMYENRYYRGSVIRGYRLLREYIKGSKICSYI